MEWTVNDIALVVSTSATALIAFSGVAVPLWVSAYEKRERRREERYAKAAEAVYFCAENIEQVVRHSQNEEFRSAFLKVGQSIPDEEERREEQRAMREFEKNFRMVQMLAEEAGVDFKQFRLHALTARMSIRKYKIIGDKLTEVPTDQDTQKHQLEATDNFVTQGAVMLKAFRDRIGLK